MNRSASPQSIADAVVRSLLDADLVPYALEHTAFAVGRAAAAMHVQTETATDPAPPPVPPRCDEDDCG